jgi:hypothetical protein
MDANKLKEAVGDRDRPALVLLRVRVLGFRTASVAGCMQFSE